jgi:hypothetical protein
MPIRRAILDDAERQALMKHLQKHAIYPFRMPFNKTVSSTFFASSGTLVKYGTIKWTPDNHLGIVSIAANFLITPNTSVANYGLAVSYSSVYSDADIGTSKLEEAQQIYELKAQGGSICDFQVFYPLTWYVEANTPIYVHLFADSARVTAGTDIMSGQVIFGTLLTGSK